MSPSEATHDEFAGGCLCGAVRFRAAGPAQNPTLCHCRTCRHASGAPLVAWATFPARSFGFTRGEPMRYRSSALVIRTFCGRCGTPLTYTRDDEPETIDVNTISLERADELAPREHIWMSHSLSWTRRLDALPRFREGRNGPRE